MLVIENALPEELFDKLKIHIFDTNFPWYYTQTVAPVQSGDCTYDRIFCHLFYQSMDEVPIKDELMKSLTDTCIASILEKTNLTIKDLYRSRTNLETIKPIKYQHTPHVDDNKKHVAGILYMNDSDGDTVFYKQRFDPSIDRHWTEDILFHQSNGGFEIEQTVSPKSNKVVLFDGFQYHGNFSPTVSHTRCVINFTFSTSDYY